MTSEKIKAVIKQWLKCHDCENSTPEECDKCGEELLGNEFIEALNEIVSEERDE